METETSTKTRTTPRVTCRACKGAGELEYGTPPPVAVGASLAYDIERRNWEPDTETCTYCDGRGTVPVGTF